MLFWQFIERWWETGRLLMAWSPEGQLLLLDIPCWCCSNASASLGSHTSLTGEANVLITNTGASFHFSISFSFQEQVTFWLSLTKNIPLKKKIISCSPALEMVKLPDMRPHSGHQQISTDFWKNKLISLISTICTLHILIEEHIQRQGKSCMAAAFAFIWSFKNSLKGMHGLQNSQPDLQPLENSSQLEPVESSSLVAAQNLAPVLCCTEAKCLKKIPDSLT